MAKYKIYSFDFGGDKFESDSMKDCVHQYYQSPLRIRARPIDNFDEKYEFEKDAWERYFRNHGRIVEIEVEGG